VRRLLIYLGFSVASTFAVEIKKTPPLRENPAVAIAAASDLIYCLPALHAAFTTTAPRTVLTVTSGSSGNLCAQISHGAPYDVFLSADLSYPHALIATQHADAASLTPYALGRLVLWTTRQDLNLNDPRTVIQHTLVKKFAIANPAHAPYGRAAQQVLTHLGLWTTVQPKLVFGENITQTAQFIQTEHADAGLIALSLVISGPLRAIGRWQEIPAAFHEPLLQTAVLTARGQANPAAVRYLDFLRSPAARTVFEHYGFILPEAPKPDAPKR